MLYRPVSGRQGRREIPRPHRWGMAPRPAAPEGAASPREADPAPVPSLLLSGDPRHRPLGGPFQKNACDFREPGASFPQLPTEFGLLFADRPSGGRRARAGHRATPGNRRPQPGRRTPADPRRAGPGRPPDEKRGPAPCARPRLRVICPDAALRRPTGYSRATTASPMAAVPSTRSAGVDPSAMSRVRRPSSSTAVTAARTSSAASPMSRL